LDSGRVDYVRIEFEKRFAIRKIERNVGVDLTPDEHVFGSQRYLLVAFAHVGANGFHDLILRKIDLRIQVGQAELAAATTAGGHLYNSERGSLIGEENAVAICRVFYFDLTREIFAGNGFAKELEGVERLAAPFNNTVDSQLFVEVGLDDLPPARSAHNDFKVVSIRVGLDRFEHLSRIVGVDGHLRRTKDRSVHTGGECDAQRIVSRDSNHPRSWSDELM